MKSNIESIDKYKLWLFSGCRDVKHVLKLLNSYGSAENVYHNINEIVLSKVLGRSNAQAEALKRMNPDRLFDKTAERALRCGIGIYFYDDDDYPNRLHECIDAPPVIFTRGNPLPKEITTVGMVGTRNYSSHGAELADIYAYFLSRSNIVIVSGMAIGIDALSAQSALRSTLEPKYVTIAVLGSGVDIPTPAENTVVYNKILEQGTVVSQFLPGSYPTRYTYPLRNRVIAGLSDALLVVEAGKKSGSLITANCALKYNRPVYTIPGRITDESFKGSNELIRKRLAVCAEEAQFFPQQVFGNKYIERIELQIESDLNDDFSPTVSEEGEVSNTESKCKNKVEEITLFDKGLDENGKRIYNALKKGPMSIDELGIITELDILTLNSSLFEMELEGIVKQGMGRTYSISK